MAGMNLKLQGYVPANRDATVKLRHSDGREIEQNATGDGPVDAALKAIERATGVDVVLRKFEVRSSLRTYLTVVVNRMYIDGRVKQWGKWRPSAIANTGRNATPGCCAAPPRPARRAPRASASPTSNAPAPC